ncbi:MAG: rRNA maturation RNase YbeY [Lachnospiraceae bacterium]|jgi:probable rRNA maturation factor|nr:rRNA maturation RNase YbeY [Lachnospiraceae bacterium]
MTCYVEFESAATLELPCEELLRRCLAAVMEEEKCPYEAQVEMVITDNASIREVNREFRHVDAATDVLSFPMIEYKSPSDFSDLEERAREYFDPDSGELMLGDMMISAEKVKEQAVLYGHSVEREFAFLTVHSLLHLCGYDHMEEEDRLLMEERQRVIMDRLGISRQ